MNEKQRQFLEKYDAIFNAYKAGNQAQANIKDPLESLSVRQKSAADFEKLTAAFKKLVYALPEEHRTTVHLAFEEKFKVHAKDRYAGYLQTVQTNRFPTAEAKKYNLFYSVPQALLRNGDVRDIVEQAVEYLDEETLDRVMGEIDAIQSDIVDNVKVEFFRVRVDALKKINAEKKLDQKHLEALNEELEKVAKTVITSTARYGTQQGEEYDKVYRNIADKRIDELNEKTLAQSEYQHFREYFEVASDGTYRGSRSISKAHVGDVKMAEVFTADNVKLTFSPEIKESMLKVFKYMSEHNMLRSGADMGEQETKVYGFAAICEAHDKLAVAIEGTDVEAIKNAREQYERELENMRGLYELIHSEFKPTPAMMIGNVNTYRTEKVPNEFKNDIVLNSLVSGFFNIHAALTQQNHTVEEMIENPGKVFVEIVKGYSQGVTAGANVKDKNVAQAIKTLTIASPRRFPGYGLPRNMEFLQAITCNSDAYEKNSFGTMLFSSYASHVGNMVFDTNGNSVTPANYLSVSSVETLANVLLVNDEDRDYDKLRAVESVSIDCTEKISAFDTLKYIETHTIDAGALINRFKDTIKELSEQEAFQKNKHTNKNTAIADTIRAAQFAAYQFLLMHPDPEECDPEITDQAEIERITKENAEKWAELKRIMEEPEVVFEDQIDEMTQEALEQRPPKHRILDAEIRAKFDAARIAERNAEKEFLRKSATLRKRFAELSEKFGTGIGEAADAIRKEYTDVRNDLSTMGVNELNRLREAYDKGYVPTSYYEQRRQDINSRNYEHFIPFDGDEYMEIARVEARKAEKAYEKQALSLIKQVNRLSKKLEKGDEKVKKQYAEVQAKLNKLKEAEYKRLDKAYADGKLTQSYYDERRYNVETNNIKKFIPFGINEAPTEKQFKAQYADDLNSNALDENDVRMFYERMMQRMRLDEFKFRQIAMGGYPKPEEQLTEFVSKNMNLDDAITQISIPEADNRDNGMKSPMVSTNKNKELNKQFVN